MRHLQLAEVKGYRTVLQMKANASGTRSVRAFLNDRI